MLNNKYYIGMHSTNNLEDGYIGSGDRIRRSLKKYGKENFNFEIINFFENRELLKQAEKEIITDEILNDDLCMNICYGGGGGYISPDGVKKGRIKTDKILKEKYGENFRNVIFRQYYDNLSDEEKKEWKKKISKSLKIYYETHLNSFTGKNHTELTKKKIGEKNSIHQKGEKNSQFGTCWITNGEINLKIKKCDVYQYPEWNKGRTLKKK
jgi:hypothetical protein